MFLVNGWTGGPNGGPLDITFTIDVVRGVSGRVQVGTVPSATKYYAVNVRIGHQMITGGAGSRIG